MNRPSFTWKLYIAAFYLFLFAPLLVVAIFAFNASQFPSPPWRGFTLEWFTGTGAVLGKPGVLMDPIWLEQHRQQLQGGDPGGAARRAHRHGECLGAGAGRVSRQDPSRHDDALAPRHPRRGARHLDPRLLLARRERARGLASDRSRFPAARPAARGAGAALLHPDHRDADHRRAPAQVRPLAGGGRASISAPAARGCCAR